MFSDRSSQVGEAKDITTWNKSNHGGKGSQDDQLPWLRQGCSGGQVGRFYCPAHTRAAGKF